VFDFVFSQLDMGYGWAGAISGAANTFLQGIGHLPAVLRPRRSGQLEGIESVAERVPQLRRRQPGQVPLHRGGN